VNPRSGSGEEQSPRGAAGRAASESTAWLSSLGGELAGRVLDKDWSLTSLGPIAHWSETLRTATSICLGSKFPLLVWWGPELVMIYNDAYRPILGRSKHPSALGSPGSSVWPEIWPLIGPMLHGVLESGEATWSDDLLLPLDRNGYLEECYFTFSYSPITDMSGSVCGVFSAVEETTDRVLSERRLETLSELAASCAAASDIDDLGRRAQAALHRNSADHPLAAVLVVDQDGTVHPAGPHLPGQGPLRSLAVEVERLARMVAEDGRPHDRARTGGSRTQAAPGSAEIGLHGLPIVRGSVGQWVVLVLGESDQRAWDAGLRAYAELCVTHLHTALTSLWEREEQRRRADALRELAEAKSLFFTNVSHEFRTPLTLLDGPVQQVLEDKGLSAEHRARLAIVQRNADRLKRLVDAMLDFSRIEVHGVSPHPRTFDVVEATQALTAGFEHPFDRAGLELAAHWGCPRLEVTLDRDMYERIVLNLLTNALKYTKEGKVTVELTAQADGTFEVSVTDTGSGIAPEDQQRIFERFERLPPQAWARSREGAGIGLAMVKELATLLAGSVTVSSQVGAGSRFTVRMPVAGPAIESARLPSITPRRADSFLAEVEGWADPAASPAEADGTAYGTAPVPDATAGAPTPTLLVVDDNSDMRRYLADALADTFRVTVAAGGAAALELIRRERPDVLLADVMMPAVDGLQLVREIRADPALTDLPVVLLSARASEQDTEEGLDLGADDYLVKPVSVRELRARLSSNLDRSRSRLRDAAWRRAITRSYRDPLLIAEESGRVLEANDAYLRVFGERPPTVPEDVSAAGSEDVALPTRGGETAWMAVAQHRVEGVAGRPPVVVHVLRDVTREHLTRERRRTAAEVSSEFVTADDLSQVIGVAMAGFAELFGGECTLLTRIGTETTAFTSAGPMPLGQVSPSLRSALLGHDGPAGEEVDRPSTPLAGLLLLPDHRPEDIRVWVEFAHPRPVSVDEQIVGDLMMQSFCLAVDRVTAAQKAAESQVHFQRALESHELVGQAVGIIVERHRVTTKTAFATLKQLSQERNTKLRDLAARVIETGLDP